MNANQAGAERWSPTLDTMKALIFVCLTLGPSALFSAPYPTVPDDAQDPDRAARQVDRSLITGASVDEGSVEATIFVDAASGDDESDGRSPTSALRTLDAAAAVARGHLERGRGVRIRLEPGVYRPTATLDFDGDEKGEAFQNALLIIESAEGGPAVISGSTENGFEPETWELIDADRRIYRHDWDKSWPMVDKGYYSLPQVEMHQRELLALDGMPLFRSQFEAIEYVDGKGRVYDEVGNMVGRNETDRGGYYPKGFFGLEAIAPGTFAVNRHGPEDEGFEGHPYPHSILLRLPEAAESIEDFKVEVGRTSPLMNLGSKSNVVLRGLVFEHAPSYANGSPGSAIETNGWADYTSFGNWLIEDCDFSRNGNEGLTLFWIRDLTVRRVKVEDNGGRGVFLQFVQNCVFEDFDVLRNNRMGGHYGFIKHSVGGVDWRAQNALFRRMRCNENYGTGFRSDVVGSNLIFSDCEFSRNRGNDHRRGNGMFQEIQFGPILVENCRFEENEGHGIFLLNVHDFEVSETLFYDNREAALSIKTSKTRTTDADMNQWGVEHHESAVPIRTCRNTVVRDSTIIGKGSEAVFVEGRGHAYAEWLREEYVGTGNRFFHAERKDAFLVETSDGKRFRGDLSDWQKVTGEDADARWTGLEGRD